MRQYRIDELAGGGRRRSAGGIDRRAGSGGVEDVRCGGGVAVGPSPGPLPVRGEGERDLCDRCCWSWRRCCCWGRGLLRTCISSRCRRSATSAGSLGISRLSIRSCARRWVGWGLCMKRGSRSLIPRPGNWHRGFAGIRITPQRAECCRCRLGRRRSFFLLMGKPKIHNRRCDGLGGGEQRDVATEGGAVCGEDGDSPRRARRAWSRSGRRAARARNLPKLSTVSPFSRSRGSPSITMGRTVMAREVYGMAARPTVVSRWSRLLPGGVAASPTASAAIWAASDAASAASCAASLAASAASWAASAAWAPLPGHRPRNGAPLPRTVALSAKRWPYSV